MSDIIADLAAIRSDADRWHDYAGQAQAISDDSGKLDINFSNTIINEYIQAYNNFCHTFSSRAAAGNKAMTAMGNAVADVARRLEAADHPK
jgi:hypothetical protein